MREHFFGGLRAVLGRELIELGTSEQRRGIETEPPRLLIEQTPPQFDTARPLLREQHVPNLAAGTRRRHERQPVAAWLVSRLRHDLDDVTVLQSRAQRHHAAVDADTNALVADVSVYRVGKVDRRRPTRQRAHLALGREDVDLLGIEIDLQVLQELGGIAYLLLHLEELTHPLEIAFVAVVADAAFLVLPVRRDAFFGATMHFVGANLYFEWKAVFADDGRVQRLVAVGPRHRNEVLDAARYRRPRLMNDAKRRVTVLDRLCGHTERDEIVDPLEIDLLTLQLVVNAEEAFDAAVQRDDRNLGVLELRTQRACQLVDHGLRALALGLDLRAERIVRLRLEVFERQLFELVLDFAHPKAVRDRRVNVERFLRDLDSPFFRQMLERPHVVEPVSELDQDDADVVNHGQQHLAEVLSLTFFTGRERNGADLRDALDDVSDFRAEQLGDALRRSQCVFNDVMQQPGSDGDHVELHVRQRISDLERVNQVGLAGMAHLTLVFERREDVRPPEELEVRFRAVTPDFLQERLESNHERWCLTIPTRVYPRRVTGGIFMIAAFALCATAAKAIRAPRYGGQGIRAPRCGGHAVRGSRCGSKAESLDWPENGSLYWPACRA